MSLTVSEFNTKLKAILSSELRSAVTITGEISNIKQSGKHIYLTLKDSAASINVIFWNTCMANKHGDKVDITGRVEYYPRLGNINFIGDTIKTVGIGALCAEYSLIYNKYESMGYFNRKLPLPLLMNNIGIITSQQGAALYDFLRVLKTNEVSATIYIYDSIVQGPLCPASLVKGIKLFEQKDKYTVSPDNKSTPEIETTNIDLVILMRGGGSFEDLLGFSHPDVVEAIYASKLYIMSAVGHEIDNMLSDFVANCRAPTPSVAGELVAKRQQDLQHQFDSFATTIKHTAKQIRTELQNYKDSLERLSITLRDPLQMAALKLNQIEHSVQSSTRTHLDRLRQRLITLQDTLIVNDPTHIVKSGYILLLDTNNNIIKNLDCILNKELFMLHADGKHKIKLQLLE